MSNIDGLILTVATPIGALARFFSVFYAFAQFLNVQWRDATSRAAGYKIADDPAALRKALKKKAKQKLASAEAWAARVKEVDESKKSKQELRNANLAARREGKPTRPKLKLSQVSGKPM